MEQHPRLWKQMLIQQLSQRYHTAQELIHSRRLKDAQEYYVDMLRIYQDICKTDLSDEDKRVAHFCLQTVYDSLNQEQEDPPLSESTFRILFSVSILVLLVGLAIVLKPTIVGLVTFDTVIAPEFTGTQTRFFITDDFTLDLANLYESNYPIDFLVTKSPTVDVEMHGSKAKFIPSNKKGMSRHTLMAISKSKSTYEVTRTPIEIVVQ